MPRDLAEGSLLLLDACCLINLLATGRSEEILRQLPYRFATSQIVATNEVLTLARGTEPDGSSQREIIPRSELEDSESLAILSLETEEERSQFVRFAADLDDGEASVCALAVVRAGAVATDDRKAIRLLDRVAPRVHIIQTPEILAQWARLSRLPQDEVGKLLRAVRERACFYPRRNAPEFEWWSSFFRE
jgi:hypothetical protein